MMTMTMDTVETDSSEGTEEVVAEVTADTEVPDTVSDLTVVDMVALCAGKDISGAQISDGLQFS